MYFCKSLNSTFHFEFSDATPVTGAPFAFLQATPSSYNFNVTVSESSLDFAVPSFHIFSAITDVFTFSYFNVFVIVTVVVFPLVDLLYDA